MPANEDTKSEHLDLDWLAFQYIAGELSAAEADDFELRLAGDQKAREAVARAVQLTDTVIAATTREERTVSLPDRAGWRRAGSWAALGAAACFVAMLVVNPGGIFRTHEPNMSAAPAPLPASDEIAVAWLELRSQLPDEVDHQVEQLTELLELEESPGGEELSDDLNAPSWMISALESLETIEEQPGQS